jgi:uncharacterized protein (DUF1330 family)
MRVSPVLVVALTGSLPLLSAGAEPPARGPLKVYVVAVAPAAMDKAQVEAQRKKADELDKAFEARLKELRKAHGKDVRKWPQDVRLEFHKQLLERNQAFAGPAYASTSAKDLEDSVENIVDSFGGKGLARKKEQVEVVDSKDDAHLVLEVVGRTGGSKLVRSPKYMTVIVRPGPKLSRGALERLPWFWDDQEGDVAPIHHPTPTEPWLQFQSWSMERWRDVANGISAVVNRLAREHYDVLVPAS